MIKSKVLYSNWGGTFYSKIWKLSLNLCFSFNFLTCIIEIVSRHLGRFSNLVKEKSQISTGLIKNYNVTLFVT